MRTARQLPDAVLVGRICRPHGVRGEVVVEVLSDHPDRFAPGSSLSAEWPDGRRRTLTVAARRPHKEALLVTFEGVRDRDEAALLRGGHLQIDRQAVAPAPPDTWYYYELLGCRCIDATAGDLGEVVDLVEDGGGLLLIVDGARGQLPIPFVKSFLRQVDVDRGVVELALPPGLIEICASGS